MRSFLYLICLLLLSGTLAAAQTAATAAPVGQIAVGHCLRRGLPSETTVDSFLHQQFGYQGRSGPGKVSSIKPAPGTGLAEVVVVLASPQGQQLTKFYVAPDGKHALVGEIIPFGAHPFEPAKERLEKGITGPSRGPKDAAVTIVEFGDLQCPACKAAQPTIEALGCCRAERAFRLPEFPPWRCTIGPQRAQPTADCVGRASNDAFWTVS